MNHHPESNAEPLRTAVHHDNYGNIHEGLLGYFGPSNMLLVAGILFGLMILAFVVSNDAAKRGRNGVLWGLFAFLAPIFAIPIYLIMIGNNVNQTYRNTVRINQKPQLPFKASTIQISQGPKLQSPNQELESPSFKTKETKLPMNEQYVIDQISPQNNNQINEVTKSSTQFCTTCGAKNSLNAIYCNKCGNKVVL